MLSTRTLSHARWGTPIDVGYPTIAASASISPTSPAAVPQDHLENVLLDYLHRLPAAQVELGVAFEELTPTETGYRLDLRGVLSGEHHVIETRFVIGADGPRSLVREQIGVAAPAGISQLVAQSVVFHAPVWDIVQDQRFLLYDVAEPVPATLLPGGSDERWVYAFSGERPESLDHDQLVDRIRRAAGAPRLPVRLGRLSNFSFTAGLADRFRAGGVFLAGDAAHRSTPRGGTGLNTAFADGFDLGWKLAWVHRGWADDTLLDTYEAERRPVAEHNVARSLDPLGSRRTAHTELPYDLNGRLPHHWILDDRGKRSSLDLVTSGLTRLSSSPPTRPAAGRSDPIARPPIADHRLDLRTATLLGADRPGGLLIRPDGVPVVA